MMAKNNKSYIVMLVLLSQTILSVTVGMLALHLSSRGHITPDVYIDSLNVGNQTKKQALAVVKEHYDKLSGYSSLVIKYGSGKEFSIKLSDIDFSINYEATINQAYSIKQNSNFSRLIKGFFSTNLKTVYPVVKFNEEKLEKKLGELALLIDEEPSRAEMYLEAGKIRKVPDRSGIKLNISNSIEKIKNELGSHLDSAIEFKPQNNFEISEVLPELTFEDLKGADCIISSYTTRIKSKDLKDSIKKGAKAINGCLVLSSGAEGEKPREFSFKQWLIKKDISFEQNYNGYSQVASTLYSALLKAGIDINCIDRKRFETPVDFISPGLDVKISEEDGDFKFRNSFDFPIAVFSECNDESITVYIVGTKRSGYLESEIEVNVVQKFEPPVLRVVNYDLMPQEEKVISSGKQGVEVEVRRILNENGKESSQLIYVNKYDAVGAIMQVGPKTKPDNQTDK